MTEVHSKCPSPTPRVCTDEDGMCRQPDKVYCTCPVVNAEARKWIIEQGAEHLFPKFEGSIPSLWPKKRTEEYNLKTYEGCEVDIYYVTQRPSYPSVYGEAFVIVAKQGHELGKDWRAYSGLTREGTDDDWKAVLAHGDQVRRDLAEFLFPDFAKKYKWSGK